MRYLDFAFLSTQDSFQVHQARHVATRNKFNALFDMIMYSIHTHLDRHRFFGHAKGAAKPTTFIGSIQGNLFEALHHI